MMIRGFLLILISVFIASCAPPETPSTRIGKHFDKFTGLSIEHRKLVRRGEITEGMPTDDVFLSWGNPSKVYEYSKSGKSGQRWDYTVSKPVRVPGSPIGGPYGRYGNRAIIYADSDYAFVPERVASVWFVGGKVTDWEKQN